MESVVRNPELELRIAILENALKISIRLQSHYAKLLNMYDGGERMEFRDISQWLDRIECLESLRENLREIPK